MTTQEFQKGIYEFVKAYRFKNFTVRHDEEPAAWITVNGNHIPIDEDRNPIGGQMKAFGEGDEIL